MHQGALRRYGEEGGQVQQAVLVLRMNLDARRAASPAMFCRHHFFLHSARTALPDTVRTALTATARGVARPTW
ncbi:hypothetical protein [Streptomyces sasae]|uniref:hypothetical protein n=1 Tax=Streptomyces sasae TaxID=1266772 RepID=UPI0029314999|nr:hypothetical protein [Streptomyces sasae]